MLLRPDATFQSSVTKQLERVFPVDVRGRTFRSELPGADVFAGTVLDPAIGLSGELGLATFARAEFNNFINATKDSLYDISTRLGVSDALGSTGAAVATQVATVYQQIGGVLTTLDRFEGDPLEAAGEIATNTAMGVLGLIAGVGGFVGWAIAAIGSAAIWANDVAQAQISAALAKNVALPPLQTVEPATDTWQVNNVYELIRSGGSGGVVFPDGGVEPASNADYTSLFMPAYKQSQPWTVQWREGGAAAQQGVGSMGSSPIGQTQHLFWPSGGFGYMPGTGTMLRVLQSASKYYQTPRGTAVDRYALRCVGVDEPCFQTKKTFDGSRDCRQCVTSESVWPVEGMGWAYGGLPLNATTPGENVGAFYTSTNRLITWIQDQIAQLGPLLYTVDTESVYYAWKETFERFWEFERAEWTRYRGAGWRGQLARFGSLMVAYERDGEMVLGGRDPRMPQRDRAVAEKLGLKVGPSERPLVADPRHDARFDVPFEFSIWSRIIAPYCVDLGQMQRSYLATINVAYVPPGAGAVFYPSGNIRKNDLGRRFEDARRELLASSKRMAVDLRRVMDPEYRQALIDSGVKPSPVKASLQGSPGTLLAPDPPRAVKPPRAISTPPLSVEVDMARAARAAIRLGAGGEPPSRARAALLLAMGAAGVAGAGVYAFDKWGRSWMPNKR